MTGFNAWHHVGSMINQSVEQSIGSPGGLHLPSTDDVQAALALVTEAWEKLAPEV